MIPPTSPEMGETSLESLPGATAGVLPLHLRPCHSCRGQKHYYSCSLCGSTGYQFPGLGRECPGGWIANHHECFPDRLHKTETYHCDPCNGTGRIADYTTETLMEVIRAQDWEIQIVSYANRTVARGDSVLIWDHFGSERKGMVGIVRIGEGLRGMDAIMLAFTRALEAATEEA